MARTWSRFERASRCRGAAPSDATCDQEVTSPRPKIILSCHCSAPDCRTDSDKDLGFLVRGVSEFQRLSWNMKAENYVQAGQRVRFSSSASRRKSLSEFPDGCEDFGQDVRRALEAVAECGCLGLSGRGDD